MILSLDRAWRLTRSVYTIKHDSPSGDHRRVVLRNGRDLVHSFITYHICQFGDMLFIRYAILY